MQFSSIFGRERVSSCAKNTPAPPIKGGDSRLREFAEANSKAVEGGIKGCGPDSPIPVPDAGARAVFNSTAVHIPIFVKASMKGKAKPYNLCEIEAIKVLNEFGSRIRRLTTGLISDAVLKRRISE